MKAAYAFIAGNSRVTPIGIALAVLAVLGLLHAQLYSYAGIAFVLLLVATLAGSIFEKPD